MGYVLNGYVWKRYVLTGYVLPFEWIRIEWIRIGGILIEWIRMEKIRIDRIRVAWIGMRYANNLLKNPATTRLSGKITNEQRFNKDFKDNIRGILPKKGFYIYCWVMFDCEKFNIDNI